MGALLDNSIPIFLQDTLAYSEVPSQLSLVAKESSIR